jgi:hypothetical protein
VALADWQAARLAALDPPDGFTGTAEDWRGLVAYMLETPPVEIDPSVEDAWERFVVGAENSAWLMFALGNDVGSLEVRPAEDASPSPGLADTQDLFARLQNELRRPDVRAMHLDVQAALLRAIERAADSTSDVRDLGALADAYLTLPAPDEHSG